MYAIRSYYDAEKIKEYVMNLEHEMVVQQTENEAGVVITSYSIHYTKLYDRVQKETMIVDGLFSTIALVSGVGGDQESVEIRRGK